MQLTITFKEGATNKDIAHELRWKANLIDGMEPKMACLVEACSTPVLLTTKPVRTTTPGTKKAKVEKTVEVEDADEEVLSEEPEVDDDDFKADDTAGSNGFDDEADSEDFEETQEEAPKPTKKNPASKAKKAVTLDDVNDACKAYAQVNGRPATLKILEKKFKTKSVTSLKPEQFEAVVAAMKVES